MITGSILRKKYIDFFVKHNHRQVSGASLIPENDPTVLFTTAGMHPLVPYFLGEKHASGKRLVNYQKCIRTVDIDEVGDDWHLTFFEMLGNWSLGDYFKEESIKMSYEFLTGAGWLGISPQKLAISFFEGDENALRDEEAKKHWLDLGIAADRIYPFGRTENWWGPAGHTGPCGPCTEIFYITDKSPCSETCSPACSCGRYVEIWNNVFLEFNKLADGSLAPLRQQNVDTGLGLERVVSVLQGAPSIYDTDFFRSIIEAIVGFAGGSQDANSPAVRIIADHIKTATFAITDGAMPSNIGAGYVVRRLIRRAIRYAHEIGITRAFVSDLASMFIDQCGDVYPELVKHRQQTLSAFNIEASRFAKTLQQGLKEFNKVIEGMKKGNLKMISGRLAFKLYDTYGFPLEITVDLAREKGLGVDVEGYNMAFKKHQNLSRTGSEKMFKGGLADHSLQTTRLHTATHLLHQALREVLGEHVYQKGSNITVDRLRFDFSHPQKVTTEELLRIEQIVNEKIRDDIPVAFNELPFEEARKQGAIGVFVERYGEKVKVYSIGNFSREICGGPHVMSTGEIGGIKIKKEEASSAGVRRIKAILVSKE